MSSNGGLISFGDFPIIADDLHIQDEIFKAFAIPKDLIEPESSFGIKPPIAKEQINIRIQQWTTAINAAIGVDDKAIDRIISEYYAKVRTWKIQRVTLGLAWLVKMLESRS